MGLDTGQAAAGSATPANLGDRIVAPRVCACSSVAVHSQPLTSLATPSIPICPHCAQIDSAATPTR
ncbi:hypothetical protein IE81DRAFT_323691 [Ceraceosorus guamensis]|uniref:Uncharacterized protein n=1 Tax=Ceraceosorus guamensis TaxID=1522189 RepID=A0A316VX64_9BASI|nr:hypothetical protein IE81DRAFT_323691 [Ceraceosorus guamensis]PWN42206.1 hypothetical protein IE81DRAFT_323691 [Ceraceosorus guamensis]